MRVLIKKFSLFFIALTVTCILVGLLFAAEDVGLEKIVITADRWGQEIVKTPAAITVISQETIKNSNARTVVDVIRSAPGVTVRSWIGNPSKVSVDMRGFGEQGGLDVLVLVDGRRINEIDQSGTDWSQIPLNQVQKIEIVHGGSGSVLYGDNAASGVINIITKKPKEGKPAWDISTEAGSFDLNRHMLSVGGMESSILYQLQASRDYTNGFRKNSFYKSNDFSAKLSRDFDNQAGLRLSSGLHKAQFGFPGALSETNLISLGRKATIYPKDHTNDSDGFVDLGASKKLSEDSTLDLDISFRRKDVHNLFLSSYAGFNPINRNKIDTVGVNPKYILEKELIGRENKLVAGFDLYRSRYSSHSYDDSDVLQNFTTIKKISKGYYAQDEFSVTDALLVQGGWRYDDVRYDFNYHDNTGFNADVNQALKPSKTVYNTGLVYRYASDSSAFFTVNRSFRYPATDEYFSVWSTPPVNTDLKPQTSQNYEWGLKHSFGHDIKADLTFFRMDIRNELYYNPLTFTNTNYDKTRHDGLELSLDSKVAERLRVTGSYTYTRSKFRGGIYDTKSVPMVPRHKANAGLKYLLTPSTTWNVFANFLDRRYFINDQANRYSRLNGYLTVDSTLGYGYKDLTLTFALNNILDRKFSEYGVCNSTTGAKNYYPAAGRNFSIKAEYKF